MARTSNKKTKEVEKNETAETVTESLESTKVVETNGNTKNIEDLKDILEDLKNVLSNLGVNISQLEGSLSSNKETSETTITANNSEEMTDSNTLLISETQSKVVLPYKIKDVKKILDENSKYETLQDVINVEYTLPINKYKNSSKSRFKEAYNLMRKKEKASIFDSLSVATEMTFNNSLNPAVITACENLDQLDVYVDCLSSNELDKFNYFKVKYEALPKK